MQAFCPPAIEYALHLVCIHSWLRDSASIGDRSDGQLRPTLKSEVSLGKEGRQEEGDDLLQVN